MSRYENYEIKNNVFGTLSAPISSLATTIQLGDGQGQRFSENMLATLENIENGKVMKREIVLITAINGDVLTVERKYAPCPVNDDANTQGKVSYAFSTDDTISAYIDKEHFDKIDDGFTNTNEEIDDLHENGTDELRTYKTTGLGVEIKPGKVLVGSSYYDFEGGTLTLTNNATNYIEIDEDGNLVVNTTGRTDENSKVSKVITSGGEVTNIEDWRLATVGGKLGGVEIHELTEKTLLSKDDEMLVADSDNIYQNKRTIVKKMGFRKIIERAILGEDITAGDYRGAVFFGNHRELTKSGADTSKNIGNSSSDYLEFTITSENQIIGKLLLDAFTIVGSGGGNLTATLTWSNTSDTVEITQAEATTAGGFDLAQIYRTKKGHWACGIGTLTIKIAQQTASGSNYYTTQVDSNSIPNYTIRDGLETGKVRLTDTDYLPTNQFDGIVLKSGNAGQIVPVQVGGFFDLTSGQYNNKKIYVNNYVTSRTEINVTGLPNVPGGDYFGVPSYNVGTLTVHSITISLGVESNRTASLWIYLNGELVAETSSQGYAELTYSVEGEVTGSRTVQYSDNYTRGYYRNLGAGYSYYEYSYRGVGGFDDKENLICLGKENNSSIQLKQNTSHILKKTYLNALDTTFSFWQDGLILVSYSVSGRNSSNVYLSYYDFGSGSRIQIWNKGFNVQGYTSTRRGQDYIPIMKGLLYKFTGGGEGASISVDGFMQM